MAIGTGSVADGASGSTNGNGNAGNGGIVIGAGSVADGTSGNANGNGQAYVYLVTNLHLQKKNHDSLCPSYRTHHFLLH